MGNVLAVCSSTKKGISKDTIDEGFFLQDYGLEGDSHASTDTHRQVSLLALSSIKKMNELGLELGPGALAENLTIEGLDLMSLPIGTRLAVGNETILEITQIGKECHTACAIRRMVGQCIMPTEGVFAKVIRSGLIKTGDEANIVDKNT